MMEQLYHFSAPGRTEISGNHTDHQHGCVLAAAVDMQTEAEVRLNGTHLILIDSEGFAPVTVDLDDLSVHESEKNTTAALVRGVAAAFQARGCKLCGFDAKVRSTVLPGSGLSSSAAFEVLIGRILNGLFFENKLSAIEIAQIGQYAENVYFGKPSGLMDQMASSVGGLVFIDFADPRAPIVEKVDFDFSHCGHTLCIIDSHASHADLTDEYAAIPTEMKQVAAFFGKEVLNDVDEQAFYAALPALRESCGDRAVLRAMHFFEENQRVKFQVRALHNDNFSAFLAYVNDSGRSSWLKLQNVTALGAAKHQEMAFTLALCKKLLNGEGAVRVHGGGFAGTALAFVPNDRFAEFKAGVEQALGDGPRHAVKIMAWALLPPPRNTKAAFRPECGFSLLCRLKEEFSVQRFSQRLADRDDEQHTAQNHARCQRVDRPQKRLMDAEGHIDQELNENRKTAREQQRAAEDIQIPRMDIAHQRHHRR